MSFILTLGPSDTVVDGLVVATKRVVCDDTSDRRKQRIES